MFFFFTAWEEEFELLFLVIPLEISTDSEISKQMLSLMFDKMNIIWN